MKKLFIVTGEPSADKHASDVVNEIKKNNADIEIEAIGGENLAKTGIKLFCNHAKMSAMGFNLKILLTHLNLGKNLVNYLKNDYKPDLVLLIDYGGFNLGISKYLKQAGIKVFYYIPPQIWASRKYRLNTVKKYIDKVFAIFPFEVEMYKNAGIDVEFVGHPLLTQMPDKADKEEFFKKYNLNPEKKLISIFPGSRKFEIKNLLKIFLEASKIIEKETNEVQFVIAQAPIIQDGFIEQEVKTDIPIIKNENYALLSISDALILASGTVALEASLYNTPMIISYKGPSILYFIYLLVRCIDKVSLPNIILGEEIVPELVQYKAKPKIIAAHILQILKDENYRNRMIGMLKEVKSKLSAEVPAANVSKAIIRELNVLSNVD